MLWTWVFQYVVLLYLAPVWSTLEQKMEQNQESRTECAVLFLAVSFYLRYLQDVLDQSEQSPTLAFKWLLWHCSPWAFLMW